MGEVWLARDLRLGRQVAVKLLPPHVTDDHDRVARLRLEARAASALNHPNVCTIHALGTTDEGRLFIAMEYIDGRTLRERLGAHPLPLGEAIDIAGQIAAGLAAAHAAGVIHRDVKPENVMIRSDGLVKVVDFGLAKVDPSVVRPDADDPTRTAVHTEGSVAGTMAYMSPEQARGLALDARTDIYSLGAVLYEMITGRPPFAGSVPALVHDGILNRTPASPRQLNPDVPPRLEDIVMKALEKERELRYQTALELRTDRIRLQRASDVPSVAAALTSPTSGLPSRRRTLRIGVVVALCAMLTAVVSFAVTHWPTLRALFFQPAVQEVQLTTNSSENPVSAAAISPDGKYLAYADQAGIHLRLIDVGETNMIAAPEIGDINRVLWFPDGSKLIVSGSPATEAGPPAIWSISIVSGVRRRLRDDGMEACVSRDGSRIAFVDSARRHVWVMGANGEEPHPLVASRSEETLWLPGFWPGDRLGFGRLRPTTDKDGVVKVEISAESRDRDGNTIELISDPGLRGAVHLPDGRVLYSLVAEPMLNRDASLWAGRADSRTGRLDDKRHVRDWTGIVTLGEFTASTDGGRVAFLKRTFQKDVYVAELTAEGSPVNLRRLTLDDSEDFATNWMPDSKAILFSSDRNGSFDIFKQALDQRTPETVVSGPDDETGPTAVSPDGTWLYYVVSPNGWRLTPARGIAVLRTPSVGGPREKVADDSRQHLVLCARHPSSVCVLAEYGGSELSIYELNETTTVRRKITSTPVGSGGPVPADISPDGSSVAIQMPNDHRIRVLSLRGGPVRDVKVTPWPLDGGAFYWSGDGAGWYVSSTPARYPAGTDLLHIDVDGHVKVISHQNVRNWMSAIPSPNGHSIALTQGSTVSNVWMLKGF
jgi:serine/threonine protein kinase